MTDDIDAYWLIVVGATYFLLAILTFLQYWDAQRDKSKKSAKRLAFFSFLLLALLSKGANFIVMYFHDSLDVPNAVSSVLPFPFYATCFSLLLFFFISIYLSAKTVQDEDISASSSSSSLSNGNNSARILSPSSRPPLSSPLSPVSSTPSSIYPNPSIMGMEKSQKRRRRRVKMALVIINIIVYLVIAAWIISAIFVFDQNTSLFLEAYYFLAVATALALGGVFLYFGTALLLLLRKNPLTSQRRQAQMRRVGGITVLCVTCFCAHAGFLLVALFDLISGADLSWPNNPVVNISSDIAFEVLPSLALLALLWKKPSWLQRRRKDGGSRDDVRTQLLLNSSSYQVA